MSNVRSFYRDASGAFRKDLTSDELRAAYKAEGGVLWVDIDASDRDQLTVLDEFGFHPLAIEDALSTKSRVKLEEYPEHLFMIVRGVVFLDSTDDPYDIDTFNIACFLTHDALVTVHTERAPGIDAVMSQLDRAPDLLSRGVERILHAVLDGAVDAYFPIIDQIEEFTDELEERVFAKFDDTALRDIFSVKRLVLSLRRHLGPMREVFNILTNRPTPLLKPETQVYFRDIYDHVLRINDSLETYRELLSSTLDSYLTQISNRLGLITKALSVIATVTLPFVVVSGMWGMNFDIIPLSHHKNGFWIMVLAQLALGAGLLAVFRRKRYL